MLTLKLKLIRSIYFYNSAEQYLTCFSDFVWVNILTVLHHDILIEKKNIQ